MSVGKEADFVVLDTDTIPLLARRTKLAQTITEKLFALFILGDDRCVESTWLYGTPRMRRASHATTTVSDVADTHAAPSNARPCC